MTITTFKRMTDKVCRTLEQQHGSIAQLLYECDPNQRSPLGSVEQIMQRIGDGFKADFLCATLEAFQPEGERDPAAANNLIELAKQRGHKDVSNYFEAIVSEHFYSSGLFHQSLYRAFNLIAKKDVRALEALLTMIPPAFSREFLSASWQSLPGTMKNNKNHGEGLDPMTGCDAPKAGSSLLSYAKDLQAAVIREVKKHATPVRNLEESALDYAKRLQRWNKMPVETPYDAVVIALQHALKGSVQKGKKLRAVKHKEKKKEKPENKYYTALISGNIKKIKQHIKEKEFYCTDHMLKDNWYTALYIVLNYQYQVKNRWAVASLLLNSMKASDLMYVHPQEQLSYLDLAEGLLEVPFQEEAFYTEGRAFIKKLQEILLQHERKLESTGSMESLSAHGEKKRVKGNHRAASLTANLDNHSPIATDPNASMEERCAASEKGNPLFSLIRWASQQKNLIERAERKKTAGEVYAKELNKALNRLLKEPLEITTLIEEVNLKGETPLHLAAKEGHHAIVAFLLPYCALNPSGRGNPLFILDATFRTPIQLAQAYNHTVLARWLHLHAAYYERRSAAQNGFQTLSTSFNKTWEAEEKKSASLASQEPMKPLANRNLAFYGRLYLRRLEKALLIFISIAFPMALLLSLIAGPIASALTFYILFHLMPVAAFIPVVVVTGLPLLMSSILAVDILSMLFMVQMVALLTTAETAVEISLRVMHDICVHRIKPFLSHAIKSGLLAFIEGRMIKQLDKELDRIRPSLINKIQEEIQGNESESLERPVLFYKPRAKKLFWKNEGDGVHCFFQPFKSLEKDEHSMPKPVLRS